MRAPVASLVRPLALALAGIALSVAWAASSAVAEEPTAGPSVVAAMASDGESADGSGASEAPVLAGSLADGMLRVSADVALVDAADGDVVEPVVGSFTVDGLTYAVVGEGQVALVAVSPRTLAGGLAGGSAAGLASASDGAEDESASGPVALEVPESVEHDGTTYSVTSIGSRAFAGCDADVVRILASVESIDELAFRGSAVKAIEVADGNPTYSSYDGMLFDADMTSLLLIPEGKQGAARIPKTASSVPPSALSHCAGVTSVEVEAGSAAYSSRNGCLYDVTGETLLRVPVGALELQVPDDCRAMAPGAMDGCELLDDASPPNADVGPLDASRSDLQLYTQRTITIVSGGLPFHRYHFNPTGGVGGTETWDYWDTWTNKTFTYTMFAGPGQFKCSWAAGACWNIQFRSSDGELWMLRVDDSTPGMTFPSLLPYGQHDEGVTLMDSVYSQVGGLGNLYALTFDDGLLFDTGVSGMPSAMGVRYMSTFTVPATVPAAGGWRFLCWSVVVNGEPIQVAPGAQGTYNVIGDTVYTARWEPISYSIAYDCLGGSMPSTYPTAYSQYSLGMQLPTPVREESRFLGWFVGGNQGSSDPAYAAGTATWLHCSSVDFPSYTTYGDLTLTANWACLISFESGVPAGEVQAIGMPERPIEVKVGDPYTFPAAPSREGYRFKSWRLDKGEGYVIDFQPGQMAYQGDNRGWTLVAQWERNDFLVKAEEGALTVDRLPLTQGGTPCEPSAEDWERVGTFGSWAGEGFVEGAGGGVMSDAGGDGTTIAYHAWVGGEKYLYEVHPERKDHLPKGWAKAGEGGAVCDGAREPLAHGEVYVAQWRLCYVISLDLNGLGALREGTSATIDTAHGLAVELPEALAYGYRFVGWGTEQDGSGDLYAAGAHEGLGLTEEPGATFILYAQWVLVTDVELPVTAAPGVAFELGVPDGSIRVAGTQADPQGEAAGWLRSRMPVEMAVTGISCEPVVGAGGGATAAFWRDHATFADVTLRASDSASELSVAGGQSLAGSAGQPLLLVPAATGKEDGTLGELGELEVLYGLSLDRLFADVADGGAGVDIAQLAPQGMGSGFAVPEGLARLTFTVAVAEPRA